MSVTAFPLERRMSFEQGLRAAAIERKARLWTPPGGRKSDEIEILSEPALRKRPKPPVIHSYPHVEFRDQVFIIPSAFAGRLKRERKKPGEQLIDETIRWPVTIRDIARAACRVFQVNMLDLCSARRSAPIVRPRQIAMYLAREMTKRSLPEIGRTFGGRDHTTVLYAWEKLTALVKDDDEAAAQVEAVRFEAIAGHRRETEQPVTG